MLAVSAVLGVGAILGGTLSRQTDAMEARIMSIRKTASTGFELKSTAGPKAPFQIPKLIHQTWKTTEIPEHWKSSYEAFQLLVKHHGFVYRLWTDEDNRNLIEQDYPWFLSKYDSYPKNIQRADAIRYFILHKFGGVYCDLDIEPKVDKFVPFFDLYSSNNVCIAGNRAGNGAGDQQWSNCFMMSVPGSLFWPHVWTFLERPFQKNTWKRALSNASDYMMIIQTTGPGLISDSYTTYPLKHQLCTIPGAIIQPGPSMRIQGSEPDDTPESVVKVLDGSSWHKETLDSAVWKTLGEANQQLTYIFIGLFAAVLFVLICVTSIYMSHMKSHRIHIKTPDSTHRIHKIFNDTIK